MHMSVHYTSRTVTIDYGTRLSCMQVFFGNFLNFVVRLSDDSDINESS